MTSSAQPLAATGTNWNIDAAHSLVEFSAKHMMITTVKGRLAGVSGTVHLDAQEPQRSRASVTIDAASIDTREPQRDAHLRSADFLDIERFPAISFDSTKMEGACANPGDRFRLSGRLAIRGITRDVVLHATYEGQRRDPWGGERASFSAETTIDRRDFGLTWNQALELGGVLVGNDIRILLEIQAVKAA
jgi:polyisoprenoid-binding protein YceI